MDCQLYSRLMSIASTVVLLLSQLVSSTDPMSCVYKPRTFPTSPPLNNCPRGLTFPTISQLKDVAPHSHTHILLRNRDYSIDSASPSEESNARRLLHLLRTTGFVHLLNHSIPEDTIITAFRKSREFFDLPEEDKINLLQLNSSNYKPIRPEQMKAPAQNVLTSKGISEPYQLRESFEVHPRTVQSQTAALPHLLPSLRLLEAEGKRVLREVFQMLAIALKCDDVNVFDQLTRAFYNDSIKSMSKLSVYLYDSLKKGQRIPVNSAYLVPHIDFGVATLIYQDQMTGLEASVISGNWVPIEPIPGSIVLIPGNVMQVLTAGVITPLLHRVAPPTSIRHGKDGTTLKVTKGKPTRQSIIHFAVPDDDALMKPLNFPRLTPKQYFKNIFHISSSVPNTVFV